MVQGGQRSSTPVTTTVVRMARRSSTLSSFIHSAALNGVGSDQNGTGPDNTLVHLLKPPPTVVRSRQGSVLTRGFILKTDHYPTGRALDLELNLQGAPNFRRAGQASLNVFGCAQPRIQGLKAILSLLRCRPDSSPAGTCVWFSTREEPIVYIGDRSFVLRDASQPRDSLSLSDRVENLEDIERRLKQDILDEASRYGGMILTHHEINEGEEMFPTWTEIDETCVLTSREVVEQIVAEGWKVEYYRIPISPDRPIEDNYLDAYAAIINDVDPVKTSLLFSCATFSMVAACILRRKLLIQKGLADPFKPTATPGTSTPAGSQAAVALEQAVKQQELSLALLRITYVIQNSMQNPTALSAVELLLAQPALMDNLRMAFKGNYSVILSLLGFLDDGLKAKQLVDSVIDSCDHVINLREDILSLRVKYSLTSMDDKKRRNYLGRAARALEKYFFIIAYASFVEEQQNETFSSWMQTRVEIWNQVRYMRKNAGRLDLFAPIADLSSISRGSRTGKIDALIENELGISGGQVVGDEWADLVVKNRSGIILRANTLLKSDQWHQEDSGETSDSIRGAINFRNMPGTRIYALGQPTIEAIDQVVARLRESYADAETVIWINLREEPLVFINGAPYCLRRESLSLRNMKDYGGISASRLEALEDRLKNDVLAEIHAFGGRVLLHTETEDGTVIPVWEEAEPSDVAVLRDIFNSRQSNNGILRFHRVPITAEHRPDVTDIEEILEIVVRSDYDRTPIVLNCQLGRGRSTISSIIVLLIQQWLHSNYVKTPQPDKSFFLPLARKKKAHHSYQVINNLLRVIRHGAFVKDAVDDAVNTCGQVYNLIDAIEDERIAAQQSTNAYEKSVHVAKGLDNLRKYFQLIVFQAYLSTTRPDTLRNQASFGKFVHDRPVLGTFLNELKEDGINALKPLERVERANGAALPDEAQSLVAGRHGSVLSASTILKSDFFANLQKMSLPERIDGAPNFRQVPLTLRYAPGSEKRLRINVRTRENDRTGFVDDGKMVCGSGMPSVEGARRLLARIGSAPGGRKKAYWTSLREEPVLYVAGRPHVLRLTDRPFKNVEATGITTADVEVIEVNLKRDAVDEVREGGGRILLHDELDDGTGDYTLTPMWETVKEDELMTPRDVFDLLVKEGYNVNYARIPITDEQAPLPDGFTQLVERVEAALVDGDELIFNCQMGRGRTTTGMVAASLISTIVQQAKQDKKLVSALDTSLNRETEEYNDPMITGHDEEVYLNGEYKIILQLVGILSHGKLAKHLTDRVIDNLDDVQNLRKAIYDYKLKVDAADEGSEKYKRLFDMGMNYMYRYALLIVLANYLIHTRSMADPSIAPTFSAWLSTRREITTLLSRRSFE
ncbi:hypothetical protein CALVIDRAFT_560340 [Calocera viscosa TUFC12733]|uniref:Inositol hexakisphosphate-domain-containing protein n=1 Tax=Calocera viscosa (strain TUFC12733) TaxID=1330018 RepID=A0A167QXM1_CALVF|nr:hypothetical protein CALVIDRAFT_560340 [Calocera viscosa TUFC12733]